MNNNQTPDLSREARIAIAIWRKAAASPTGGLTINLPTHPAAMTFRMGLYRHVKAYRANPMLDAELTGILNEYSVLNPKPGQTFIQIVKKQFLGMSADVMDQLGLDEADLLTDSERSMMEMSRRLSGDLSGLGDPDTSAPSNPTSTPNKFFSRD